jgi:hypothetical protein
MLISFFLPGNRYNYVPGDIKLIVKIFFENSLSKGSEYCPNSLYSIIRLLSHTLACEATFFISLNNCYDRSSTF